MSTNKSDEIKVRVSPAMKAAIVKLATHRGEGESVIVREAINRYLNEVQPLRETPPPYAASSPAPAATAAEAAAAALVARGAATLAPTPAAASPSASISAPAAAGPPRRGGRPKPPVRALK